MTFGDSVYNVILKSLNYLYPIVERLMDNALSILALVTFENWSSDHAIIFWI